MKMQPAQDYMIALNLGFGIISRARNPAPGIHAYFLMLSLGVIYDDIGGKLKKHKIVSNFLKPFKNTLIRSQCSRAPGALDGEAGAAFLGDGKDRNNIP